MVPSLSSSLTSVESMPILELERRCRHHGWLAERLFEVTGRWTATAQPPDVRVVLAAVSTDLARHATEWAQRTPDLSGYRSETDEDLASHPRSGAVAALADSGPTPLALEALHDLLTDWIEELAAWNNSIDARLDGPTARLIARLLDDLGRLRIALTPTSSS